MSNSPPSLTHNTKSQTMNLLHAKPCFSSSSSSSSSLFLFLTIILIIIHLPSPSSPSSLDSFVYVGCSHLKFTPGDPYDSNLHSILSSISDASAISSFNAFNISLPSDATNVIYGLFQCRGDLTTSDCHDCVSKTAIARLGTSCAGAVAGAVQMEGCFVRYDNTSFVGVEDKTVVSEKCGPSITEDDETARDAAMAYLAGGGGEYFRVGGSGKVHGMAQCVEDLSVADCQDCLTEAIQRLKSECGAAAAAWGDMFLGKCYARYTERGFTSINDRDNHEMEKTLAVFFGIVAGIAILIIILTIARNVYGPKGGK